MKLEWKQCPNCGEEIPKDASFCPACMAELVQRESTPPPPERRKWLGVLLGALGGAAVTAAVLLLILLPRLETPPVPEEPPAAEGPVLPDGPVEPKEPTVPDEPKAPGVPDAPDTPDEPEAPDVPDVPDTPDTPDVSDESDVPAETEGPDASDVPAAPEEPTDPAGQVYDDGGNELFYQDGTTTYRLTAHFNYYMGDGPNPTNDTKQWEFVAGEAWNTMFYLSVWDGKTYDPELRDRFVELVDRVCMTVADVEGDRILAVNSYGRTRAEENPAYESSVGLLTGGVGRTCWELTMKNGDTIRLYGTVELSVRQVVKASLGTEDAPDLAALQARLEELYRETPEKDLLQVTLPPVAYKGELSLTERSLRLVGSSDGEKRTSLAGTLTVGVQDREPVRVTGVDFLGDGGRGLAATSAVILRNCLFTGYDKAVDWLDGAWVECGNCTFRDNGVAIECSGRLYKYSQPVYVGDLFENNGVAWRFLTSYESEVFSFENTRFVGNGTDIENPGGAALDTSGAIFE